MLCLSIIILLVFIFGIATVILMRSTIHDTCVVFDMYAIDSGMRIIKSEDEIDGKFEIYATFLPPVSSNIKYVTLRLMKGNGQSEYLYMIDMVKATYNVGSVHECLIRVFPSPKVTLERSHDSIIRGFDNLTIATGLATAAFVSCALLFMCMIYFKIRIKIEEDVKAWAREKMDSVREVVNVY